jgi:hypothetical protein
MLKLPLKIQTFLYAWHIYIILVILLLITSVLFASLIIDIAESLLTGFLKNGAC